MNLPYTCQSFEKSCKEVAEGILLYIENLVELSPKGGSNLTS